MQCSCKSFDLINVSGQDASFVRYRLENERQVTHCVAARSENSGGSFHSKEEEEDKLLHLAEYLLRDRPSEQT